MVKFSHKTYVIVCINNDILEILRIDCKYIIVYNKYIVIEQVFEKVYIDERMVLT